MDSIWWNKIPNASSFLQAVSSELLNSNSVILQLPENVPWYNTMKSIIEEDVEKQNSTGSFKDIDVMSTDPGEFLFNKHCKPEMRAEYRPSIGYARFLASKDTLNLHDNIMWVITETEAQLMSWISFIDEYYKHIGKNRNRCVFVLETRLLNTPSEKKGIKRISYVDSIEHYDNVLFNMLAASSLKGTEMFKRYLAEVVSLMFPNDVELSAKCIASGKEFLINRESVLKKISDCESRSNGDCFEVILFEDEQNEKVWEAQIKVLFPIIERYRNKIVKKYRNEIESALPITTNYGDEITSADDVELGLIISIVASGKLRISSSDYDCVYKMKTARNGLAHFGVLSQDEVDYVLSIEI